MEPASDDAAPASEWWLAPTASTVATGARSRYRASMLIGTRLLGTALLGTLLLVWGCDDDPDTNTGGSDAEAGGDATSDSQPTTGDATVDAPATPADAMADSADSAVVCDDGAAPNACGGCGQLVSGQGAPAVIGDSCGPCGVGTFGCRDTMTVKCNGC